MPDTTFGDFIPINPMFDGDPQVYSTAEGTAGLDTGLYMTIFQGYLEKLALGLLVSLSGPGRGLVVANVLSAPYEIKAGNRSIGNNATARHGFHTYAG